MTGMETGTTRAGPLHPRDKRRASTMDAGMRGPMDGSGVGRLFGEVGRLGRLALSQQLADLIHPQRRRMVSPLIDRLAGNAQRFGQFPGSAEGGDGFVGRHGCGF